MHHPAITFLRSGFRRAIPAHSTPAIGTANSHTSANPIPPAFADLAPELGPEVGSLRFSLGTGYWVPRIELPWYGPVVAIVSVTEVVPAPAAIDVGLKLQLVSAGRFAHAKLTAPLNVAPPIGAAENV